MRKVTIKLYTFDELTEDVQQRVIKDNKQINIDYQYLISLDLDYETLKDTIEGLLEEKAIVEAIKFKKLEFTKDGTTFGYSNRT